MNSDYVRTVQLLLDVAPEVFANPSFAFKGGTALNLFLHDLPRLSVDIDVVFVPHAIGRKRALAQIEEELIGVQARIERRGHRAWVPTAAQGEEVRLFVQTEDVQVKVEVNHVFRGTVLPVQRRTLSRAAQATFATNIEVPVLATAEVYASKLVAALGRQHPRDLFDVMQMLEVGHRWDEGTLDCFVVYLAGHNRPMHEVLFPTLRPLKAIFESEFSGMTAVPVEVDELERVRQNLLDDLPRALEPRQREFLLSVARAQPDWSLLPQPHICDLPALQWKLQNLTKLRRNTSKFALQHDELARRLGRTAPG